jgi:hypothetical protein
VTVGFPCPPRKYTAAIRYCSDRGALRGAALVVQLPATDTSCWPELSNRYLDLLERKDRPGPARALDARHHPGHLCPCHRGGRPGRS